jgi:uncharacterized delta-60 repeat protein
MNSNTLSRVFLLALAKALALAIGAFFPSLGYAAPGEFDSGFAVVVPGVTYGRITHAVGAGTANTSVGAVVALPNGNILVGGTCNSTFNSAGASDSVLKARFCVTRYRAPSALVTGSWIDTSFGNQGTTGIAIHTIYSNRPEELADMAVLPDGKILIAGTCSLATSSFFCVMRLQANGTLDSTFGSQGSASPIFSVDARLKKILLQPDGRIVLLGNCTQTTSPSTQQFCLTRLLANGSIDASFANNGVALLTTAFDRNLQGAALRADGGIVLAGVCSDVGRNLCVRALTSIGQQDSNFGATNNATNTTHISMGTSIGGDVSIARTASGKFVLAINCVNTLTLANTYLFCLARVNDNGSLDSSFGSNGVNGRAYHRIGGLGSANAGPFAIAIQPDGKIVLGGFCSDPTIDFCVARIHSEGPLDTSYDGVGFHTTLSTKPLAFGTALALQSDGKVVVSGPCTDAGLSKYCTVRLDGGPFGYKDCTMDIDGDGRVLGPTDALIHARVASGMSGAQVTSGLAFAPRARRTTWEAIRDYLGNQCGMMVSP